MTALLLAVALAAPVPKDGKPDAGWREFRGPDGTGHYAGPAVPETWGPDTNVAWKTPVGSGWSSPVVHNGKVYLTAAVPQGKGSYELRLVCLDAGSGAIDWDKLVFSEDTKATPQPHSKNSHASSTPLVDGEYVYAHFAHLGTACYSVKGEQKWATQEYPYKPVHGSGGSPVLADGKLVVSADGADKQYVLALHADTGKEAWKTDRKTKASRTFSFTTPQVIEQGKKKLVLSQASDFLAAYDLVDGKEAWRANFPKPPGYSCICRPVLAGGLWVISTGYDTPMLLAIDPEKGEIKWQRNKHAPNTPTPLAVGDSLYTVSDAGMMSCIDAKSGTVHWEEKLKGKGFSASLVLLNGKIYATSEDGVGSVIEPDTKELKVEEGGQMKEKTFATFAAADGGLYVRTETKLYKFATKR